MTLLSETLSPAMLEPLPFPDDESGLPPGPLELCDSQANPQSWVWFSKQLAVARYQLSETEQKLLLFSIAMIDGTDSVLACYRINVVAYAQACGIATNALYSQLKDAAKSIKAKPLLIAGHRANDGKIVELLTSWFSEVEFGVGYIDVTFPPKLRRYLLRVKKDYLKFELSVPLHLSGEYAIRLYQFAKMWKFTGHPKLVKLGDLRITLGLIKMDTTGKIVGERLAQYGDLKTWALKPALSELAKHSDILVLMKEIKKPKSKTVEAVEFTILDNPNYVPVADAPKLSPGVRVAAPIDPEITARTNALREEFGVSPQVARMIVGKYPAKYIEEKAAIVRLLPSDNIAALFVSAVEKDYQPKKGHKPAKPLKKAAPAPVVEASAPVLTPEEVARDKAAVDRHMAAFRKKMKGGPKIAADQAELPLAVLAASVEEVEEVAF